MQKGGLESFLQLGPPEKEKGKILSKTRLRMSMKTEEKTTGKGSSRPHVSRTRALAVAGAAAAHTVRFFGKAGVADARAIDAFPAVAIVVARALRRVVAVVVAVARAATAPVVLALWAIVESVAGTSTIQAHAMTAKAVVLATVTGKTLGVVIKLLGRNLPAREAGLGTFPEDLQVG